MMSNQWDNNTDSDEEYNEEDIQNEVSPPQISEEFTDKILGAKHSLYENIVLAPPMETDEAQSTELLQKYLNNLNDVYVLSLNAENSSVSDDVLAQFPKESIPAIKTALTWITDFFSKNRAPDTIPYKDFIRNSYHVYPFVQKDSFE